eukprot:533304_1
MTEEQAVDLKYLVDEQIQGMESLALIGALTFGFSVSALTSSDITRDHDDVLVQLWILFSSVAFGMAGYGTTVLCMQFNSIKQLTARKDYIALKKYLSDTQKWFTIAQALVFFSLWVFSMNTILYAFMQYGVHFGTVTGGAIACFLGNWSTFAAVKSHLGCRGYWKDPVEH